MKDPALMTTDERVQELAKIVIELAEIIMRGGSYSEQACAAQKTKSRAVALADRVAF